MVAGNAVPFPFVRPNEGGFSIVEFTITLLIASIGLALAVPLLQTFTANNQVNAASNALVTGMNLARSSAITSGENITICPSTDESACTENAWNGGWIVFNDADNDSIPDAGEVLRVITLEGDLAETGYGASIVFQPDGTTLLDTDATITNCFADEDISSACYDITVSTFGSIESHKHDSE